MDQSRGTLNLDAQYPDLADIPGASSWLQLAEMNHLEKTERRFAVIDRLERRYILKISAPTHYDRTKREYEHLKAIRACGVAVPDPIGFGLCGQGKWIYLQTGWVGGHSIAENLGKLSFNRQYALGTDAGVYLKKIHYCAIPTRPTIQPLQFQTRYHKAATAYRLGREHFTGVHKIHRMIQAIPPLPADSPACLIHGRFQPGNLVLTSNDQLFLAHSADWQYGDPLHDLANVLTWIRTISLPFAIGILDCYYSFQISESVMKRLSAFAALDLLEQFTDAQKMGSAAVWQVEQQIDLFCKDHPGEQGKGPTWYKMMRKASVINA